MSVKAELEELVKWISDLSEPETPTPTPEAPGREDWQALDRDLDEAARRFGEAAEKLAAADPPQAALADFALDLQRESEGLALRAHILSRRAVPKPKPAKVAGAGEPHARAAEGPAAGTAPESDSAPRAGTPPKAQTAPPSSARIAGQAGDVVERAHRHLDYVEHPDAVAQAFEAELEVLAEMALSLRQQCEHLPDNRKPRQRSQDTAAPAGEQPPAKENG